MIYSFGDHKGQKALMNYDYDFQTVKFFTSSQGVQESHICIMNPPIFMTTTDVRHLCAAISHGFEAAFRARTDWVESKAAWSSKIGAVRNR